MIAMSTTIGALATTYEGSKTRAAGRIRTANNIDALVVRMAEESRERDYRRIQGAISNLGHEVVPSTIADILQGHETQPVPERSRKTTWKEFLTRHWEIIVAAEVFTGRSVDPPRAVTVSSCGSSWSSRREKWDSRYRHDRKWLVDEPDRPESGGRCRPSSKGQTLPDSRPQLVVYDRTSRHFYRGGSQLDQVAAAFTKSERPCGAICPQHRGILPGSHDLIRRELVAQGGFEIRMLAKECSSRTGLRQQDHEQ